MGQEGKLPEHLQKQEAKLMRALSDLRCAHDVALKVEEQLKVTLQHAKQVLDENNY